MASAARRRLAPNSMATVQNRVQPNDDVFSANAKAGRLAVELPPHRGDTLECNPCNGLCRTCLGGSAFRRYQNERDGQFDSVRAHCSRTGSRRGHPGPVPAAFSLIRPPQLGRLCQAPGRQNGAGRLPERQYRLRRRDTEARSRARADPCAAGGGGDCPELRLPSSLMARSGTKRSRRSILRPAAPSLPVEIGRGRPAGHLAAERPQTSVVSTAMLPCVARE